MATIREFDADQDAERVASFYNEQGYGPIAAGRAATARVIVDVLQERGVRLFIVAEQHGRIVGTLGYARMSGRRVAPDRQLFAVMFLVSPSLRAGFLVSQLFTDSFQRFAALGARSLRVEVDPLNRRAFPLYVRIGFRLIGDGRPDEDGYIELVNHLPGIASDLQSGSGSVVGGSSQQYSGRTIRDARKQTLTSGVERADDGTTTISYELEVDGRPIKAVTDADTGRLVSATVDGAEPEHGPAVEEPRSIRSGADELRHATGTFQVLLQPLDGTIRIEHPRHVGPLVVDPFPVGVAIPAGVRRPARRRVTTTASGTRWISTDGEIVRTVELGFEAVSITASSRAPGSVTVLPWSGFRSASLTVVPPNGESRSRRYVRGVWPPDLTDFEAAIGESHVIEANGTNALWSDVGSGLELGVEALSPGRWRIEGPHLAHLTGDGRVSYRYVPRERPERGVVVSPRGPSVVAEGQDTSGRRPGTLDASGDPRYGVLERDDTTVVVDPNEGVMRWRSGHDDLVGHNAPPGRIGPLEGVRAAAWFAVQPDRSDPDLGAVWAGPDPRLTYQADLDGWHVQPVSGARAVVLRSRTSGGDTSARELVTYLALPDGAVPELWDPEQGWITVDDRVPAWRAWTRRCRVRLAEGSIEIDPVLARFPEILVRRGTFGVLLAMFARIESDCSEAAWQMCHRPPGTRSSPGASGG